jgi:SAM-dependent methyltransferase
MTNIPQVDPQWYKKVWTLDIQDASWVEGTATEVDFIVDVLSLSDGERVLDLACGFGRHSLELARRGHKVVGVDITETYIAEAARHATKEKLDARFICADLREVSFGPEFDVVLNLADGAIGFLENDDENLKIFDLVASSLKGGGRHIMGVTNAGYARKHFPRRHWEIGARSVALADFVWDQSLRRMLYTGHTLKFGEILKVPNDSTSSIRLYTIEELTTILSYRGMAVDNAFGAYEKSIPASDDRFPLIVCSHKP